ncbi:MAG: helix-turn-helix domain-containing protein, partial [Candidatus Puniceispirillaceae bacterium]
VTSTHSDDANNVLEQGLSMALRDARELFEKYYMTAQLGRFDGNISQMAKFVGMERSALHRKLKTLDIVGEQE